MDVAIAQTIKFSRPEYAVVCQSETLRVISNGSYHCRMGWGWFDMDNSIYLKSDFLVHYTKGNGFPLCEPHSGKDWCSDKNPVLWNHFGRKCREESKHPLIRGFEEHRYDFEYKIKISDTPQLVNDYVIVSGVELFLFFEPVFDVVDVGVVGDEVVIVHELEVEWDGGGDG